MKKRKTYTYYSWLTGVKGDDIWKMHTQLYRTGIYVAITNNRNPTEQLTADPKRFGKQQRKHIKLLEADGYTVTRPTTQKHVYEDKDGLWVEDREASKAVNT
jgi:hypothetical protein